MAPSLRIEKYFRKSHNWTNTEGPETGLLFWLWPKNLVVFINPYFHLQIQSSSALYPQKRWCAELLLDGLSGRTLDILLLDLASNSTRPRHILYWERIEVTIVTMQRNTWSQTAHSCQWLFRLQVLQSVLLWHWPRQPNAPGTRCPDRFVSGTPRWCLRWGRQTLAGASHPRGSCPLSSAFGCCPRRTQGQGTSSEKEVLDCIEKTGRQVILGWEGRAHIRDRLSAEGKESLGKPWQHRGPEEVEPRSCSRRRWRWGPRRGRQCPGPWSCPQVRRCRGSRCRRPGCRPIPTFQLLAFQAGQNN